MCVCWYACAQRQLAHAPYTHHCSLFIVHFCAHPSRPDGPLPWPIWFSLMGEVTVRPYLCASSLKIGVLRVCVCTHLNMVTDGAFSCSKPAVNFRQGAQARLGYPCQRSYSKMGEGWSDQPPVPANAATQCTHKCVASIMGRIAKLSLLSCCNLFLSCLVLSVFLRINTCRAKVCVVLAYPKFGARSQRAKARARASGCTT